jgi:hypothetical protein
MSCPFKTPEFRALFRKWNKKLAAAGQEEIEDFSREEPVLQSWETYRWNKTDPIRNEWRQQYYEMAEALLHTFKFKSRQHRRIWELHCQGISARKIADLLNQKGLKKTTIYAVILTIEIESGLKRG